MSQFSRNFPQFSNFPAIFRNWFRPPPPQPQSPPPPARREAGPPLRGGVASGACRGRCRCTVPWRVAKVCAAPLCSAPSRSERWSVLCRAPLRCAHAPPNVTPAEGPAQLLHGAPAAHSPKGGGNTKLSTQARPRALHPPMFWPFPACFCHRPSRNPPPPPRDALERPYTVGGGGGYPPPPDQSDHRGKQPNFTIRKI